MEQIKTNNSVTDKLITRAFQRKQQKFSFEDAESPPYEQSKSPENENNLVINNEQDPIADANDDSDPVQEIHPNEKALDLVRLANACLNEEDDLEREEAIPETNANIIKNKEKNIPISPIAEEAQLFIGIKSPETKQIIPQCKRELHELSKQLSHSIKAISLSTLSVYTLNP